MIISMLNAGLVRVVVANLLLYVNAKKTILVANL